jgi:hypothetical protein
VFFDLDAYSKEIDSKIESGEAWDEIPAYDPSQEELSLARVSVFSPGFAIAEKLISKVVIQPVLNQVCTLKTKTPSAELCHIEERTRKLSAPSYGLSVNVGADGPVGKGRTSTINVVLGIPELAHEVR